MYLYVDNGWLSSKEEKFLNSGDMDLWSSIGAKKSEWVGIQKAVFDFLLVHYWFIKWLALVGFPILALLP